MKKWKDRNFFFQNGDTLNPSIPRKTPQQQHHFISWHNGHEKFTCLVKFAILHFRDKTGNMPVKLTVTIIQQFYKKNHNHHQFFSQSIFHSGLCHKILWTYKNISNQIQTLSFSPTKVGKAWTRYSETTLEGTWAVSSRVGKGQNSRMLTQEQQWTELRISRIYQHQVGRTIIDFPNSLLWGSRCEFPGVNFAYG